MRKQVQVKWGLKELMPNLAKDLEIHEEASMFTVPNYKILNKSWFEWIKEKLSKVA